MKKPLTPNQKSGIIKIVKGDGNRKTAGKLLKKSFEKPLTNPTEYGIMNIESDMRNIADEVKRAPHPPRKKDRVDRLLATLAQYQADGDTPEQAIEKLSVDQYDFLIDYGVNLDNLILTPEQQEAIAQITRAPRPKGLTYNKSYPKERQDLYNTLADCIIEQGGLEVVRNKNFRDLDFEINGVKYKLVLSNPRTPKN